MFIKKRGKAKTKAEAERKEDGAANAAGGGGGAAAAGSGLLPNEDDFDHRLGNYQLMEPIGKGGYGTVYRGLNIERGMTVAVKRVNLHGIPHEELESIEQEIRLLQNLAHPNIVKYLDSIRQDDYLNIILEFVENGSLSSLLVKFGGMFPEQLVAHYITQVLKGLHYLHTQGVIHRDIKGANILSTKEGVVKLADFGVATKLNESRKSDSVVGTPYWMAPEIIEMTGQQSSACDVWSVGCTCVELLTGKPPYFDLQQMPALFRIVQDEHPPLPENISRQLEDFLMQCFQKDPNRRISAAGLLKHPWLRKSVEQQELADMQRMVEEKSQAASAVKKTAAGASSSQPESEESEDEEENHSKPTHHRGSGKHGKSAGTKKSTGAPLAGALSDNEDWDNEEMDAFDEDAPVPTHTGPPAGAKHKPHAPSSADQFPGAKKKPTGKAAKSTAADNANDEDSDGPELVIKLRSPDLEEDDPFAEFSDEEQVVEKTSMKTIRPTPQISAASLVLPGAKKNEAHVAAKPTAAVVPTGVAGVGAAAHSHDAAHPATVATITSAPNSLSSTNSSNVSSAVASGANTLTNSGSSFILNGLNNTSSAASSASAIASGTANTMAVPRKLEAFVENDDEELDDYGELEADLEVKAGPGLAAHQPVPHHNKTNSIVSAANNLAMAQAAHMQSSSKQPVAVKDLDPFAAAEAGEEDESDPFDDIAFDDDFEKDDSSSNENTRLSKEVIKVLDQLSPTNDERTILTACANLHELGQKNPDLIRSLMTSHGVIPIMEMLEVNNIHILHAVLKVVNQIVGKNVKFQQNMSLVGLIPAIIRFGGPTYPTEIRMESASFVRQFCYASDWTRKMFIACDGLPVLVSFLLEDYQHSKTLVWNALDCIRHVFDITSNPKNDFCRLFCKFGLLEPLSRTLIAINADKESIDAPEYVLKISKILHLFSQGDKVVKNHFAKPQVIECMLKVLPDLSQDCLILLLKSIRNISMDSTTLDLLESAGAIPALIPFLDVNQVNENQHQVLLTMYYLCQIKSSRQEQAAMSGIIPHLQRFIAMDHPLKQFAYPIIFLLAKTSWRSRAELKKHGGIQFYIDILTSSDVYWRSYALEILSFWLSASSEDTARVSFLLNTSVNINKLLRVFRETTDDVQFDKMLPSMRKILVTSVKVNQSLGRGKEFIAEIRNRLQNHSTSNNIRINLLKILSLLLAGHAEPLQLAIEADLKPVLIRLLEDKSAVIVESLTQKILRTYCGYEGK